jgi:hypothetical protein
MNVKPIFAIRMGTCGAGNLARSRLSAGEPPEKAAAAKIGRPPIVAKLNRLQ